MAVEYDYDGLINGVVGEIKEVLAGGATVVLVPPASSRGEIVKRLARELPGLEILSYRKLHEKTGVGKALDFRRGRLLVEGLSIVEYVKGGGRLSEALGVGRVIVTESTVEALGIYYVLCEELREELVEQGKPIKEAQNLAEEHVKKRVKICFPPSHYEKKIKLEDEVKRVVEINYEDALQGLVENPRGISLKLLHELEERQKYIAKGVEAIRKLSPGKVGLGDALRRTVEALPKILPETLVATPLTLGGAVLASALATLAGSPGVLANAIGVDISKGFLKKFLVGTFEPRDPSLTQVASLLKVVLAAEKYVGDDVFEGVVDEVAVAWGLSIEEFRKFVENLRAMATEKLVSEEELKKLKTLSDEEFRENLDKLFEGRLDKLRGEMEGRLDKIKEEMEELRKEVKDQRERLTQLRVLRNSYEEPGDLRFDLEKNTFKLEGSKYEVVTSGEFNKYVDDILAGIDRGDFVVLIGPKGVGKSVLARYSLAKALERGPYTVYEIETLDEKSVIHLDGLHVIADRMFDRRLVLFYDPAAPVYYEPGRETTFITEGVEGTVKELARFYRTRKGGTPVVLVLPEDVFEQMKIEDAFIIRVDLNQEDFLAGIVRVYSGGACDANVYNRIGKTIAKRYSGGYTLVARYAGEWLRRKGCAVEDVEEAVEAGAGSAEAFVALYIYKSVFRGNSNLFAKFTIPFMVRAELGPMPPKWLERFPVVKESRSGRGVECEVVDPLENLRDCEKEFIRSWLSHGHEDIVEEVIRGIAKGMLSERLKRLTEGKPKRQEATGSTKSVKELPTISENVEEIVKKLEEKIRKVRELLKRVRVPGECREGDPVEVLFQALANSEDLRKVAEQCREDFALAIGFAYSPYPLWTELLKCEGREDLLEQLKMWLTSNGEMPLSARIFFTKKATAFKDAIKPYDLLSSIYARANAKGSLSGWDIFITLGVFAASGGELTDCLEVATPFVISFLYSIPMSIACLGYLDKAFTAFAEDLVRRDLDEWAAAMVYAVSSQSPFLAEKILKRMDESKLGWVARLYYEEAFFSVVRALMPEMISGWVKHVRALVERECADAPCLYTKAMLSPELACVAEGLGYAEGAMKWIEEALRAVEELEKRDNLAEELAPLLRIARPFMEPEKAAENILIELKRFVLDTAALLALSLDVDMALEYAEEAYRIAKKLVPRESVASYNKLAKAMFLKGKPEAVEAFRENMKSLQRKAFWGFDNETISVIVAGYIASFLAEGNAEMALCEYKGHRHLIKHPVIRAILPGLLFAHGLDVEEEFEDARRPAFIHEAPALLKGILRYLYGLDGREEACKGLKDEDRRTCKKILEAVDSGEPKLLRKLLRDRGLISREEELLLEELSDPLEVLEVAVAMGNNMAAFLEIAHSIRTGRVDIARKLAEYWRKECEEAGMSVQASLFGELASSLEGGQCGEECRRALLKLFYLLV